MGYYINKINNKTLPPNGKANFLLREGAKIAPTPITFQENLVCVVENFHFDAAGYAYSKEEMDVFLKPDGRNKTWLIVPDADILSNFKN